MLLFIYKIKEIVLRESVCQNNSKNEVDQLEVQYNQDFIMNHKASFIRMNSGTIAERVELGLTKAKLIDAEKRKRGGKLRGQTYLPPVQPKTNMQFRPALDHRMPTLGNNGIFCLQLNKPPHGKLSQEELKVLENRPPHHLHEIRSILSRELEKVGKELVRIERKYYGIHRSLSQQLRKHVPVVKMVMSAVGVDEIRSLGRVEEILKKITEMKEKFKEDLSHAILLKELAGKVKEFTSERFAAILEHCWKIFNLLDKYCISFHSPDFEMSIDTVVHYYQQIFCWRDTIIKNLENVLKMSRQLRQDGVRFNTLSSNVIQAGEQYQCSNIPLLLVIPEACANIRNSSYVMASWLKADENYCTFLRNDVFDLEKKKESTVRTMREVREKFHSVTYKLTQAEIEANKLFTEVLQLKDKEDVLWSEEQFLTQKLTAMELEIEVKEFRCAELRKSAKTDTVSMEMCDQLAADVRVLMEHFPFLKRQLSNVRYKLGWIRSRRKSLESANRAVDTAKDQLVTVRAEKLKAEKEYHKTETQLEITRKIHMFKTTPGVVHRLFYGLSLDVSSSKTQRSLSENDPLFKACDVVSCFIEKDWSKLYRNLPFQPLRGQVTVERDIQEIGNEANRLAMADHASRALTRWRRFHTRAKVDDLLNCLRKIKRSDVAYQVDLELNPPGLTNSEDEDDKNLPVGPELVPFYRQVERYDKLRATKKLQ